MSEDPRPLDRDVVQIPELPRSGWGLALARGIYYRPKGGWPRVAFIACHYELDFSHHYMAELLARHGFGFLGWNTRFCGLGHLFREDGALRDVDSGVGWLRQHGAEAVVLLGNSGGGSLLAAYHARVRPDSELYVSLAAHPGRSEVLTSSLDPAVTDERDPLASDPALDMYNTANGPPYSEDFVTHYRRAQRDRNDRISEWCRKELERVKAGGYADRLFTVARTWADLRFTDPNLDPSERPTPGCYRGDPQQANKGVIGLCAVSSLRSWLEMWSLQETDRRAEGNLGAIQAPALVVQARADCGVFPSDARSILEALGSTDKRLAEAPGDHYFQEPPDARMDVAQLISQWVIERVGAP